MAWKISLDSGIDRADEYKLVMDLVREIISASDLDDREKEAILKAIVSEYVGRKIVTAIEEEIMPKLQTSFTKKMLRVTENVS